MYRGIADNSQRHPVHPRRLVDDAVAGAFWPGDQECTPSTRRQESRCRGRISACRWLILPTAEASNLRLHGVHNTSRRDALSGISNQKSLGMKPSKTAFSTENAPVFAGVYSGYAPVGGGEGHCTLQWHRDDTHPSRRRASYRFVGASRTRTTLVGADSLSVTRA